MRRALPVALRCVAHAACAIVADDKVGAELVERTGRNPSYMYQSLGCSKKAVAKMLSFARKQVGVPFSNYGMARSILWPRTTDGTSYFCAELVACVLKEGGLLEASSNPGAATPEMLYRIYKDQAAATANPYVLRDINATSALTSGSTMGTGGDGAQHEQRPAAAAQEERRRGRRPVHHRRRHRAGARRRASRGAAAAAAAAAGGVCGPAARAGAVGAHAARSWASGAAGDSPPRGHFRVITHCAGSSAAAAAAAAACGRSSREGSGRGCADAEQFRYVASVAF